MVFGWRLISLKVWFFLIIVLFYILIKLINDNITYYCIYTNTTYLAADFTPPPNEATKKIGKSNNATTTTKKKNIVPSSQSRVPRKTSRPKYLADYVWMIQQLQYIKHSSDYCNYIMDLYLTCCIAYFANYFCLK